MEEEVFVTAAAGEVAAVAVAAEAFFCVLVPVVMVKVVIDGIVELIGERVYTVEVSVRHILEAPICVEGERTIRHVVHEARDESSLAVVVAPPKDLVVEVGQPVQRPRSCLLLPLAGQGIEAFGAAPGPPKAREFGVADELGARLDFAPPAPPPAVVLPR